MNAAYETRERQRDAAPDCEAEEEEDEGSQDFWAWFALGVLMFCWIAEASMCAVRGF